MAMTMIAVETNPGNLNGHAYLKRAQVVRHLLAEGAPQPQAMAFKGNSPTIKMFGGLVVGASIFPDKVMYLPVMDEGNAPIAAEDATARDISDSQQRAIVKAAAAFTGLGLSIYANMGGDGPGFAEAVGVKSEVANLLDVTPMEETLPDGTKYVPWYAAIAAAGIMDPAFVWEVVEFQDGLLYQKAEGVGYLVGVQVRLKKSGRVSHTEYLPIMSGADGDRGDALENPTVFDWNTAVMRCLAKAVAYATGYGLSVYAGGGGVSGTARGEEVQNERTLKIVAIRSFLRANKKSEGDMLKWLRKADFKESDKLEDLTDEEIAQAINALKIKEEDIKKSL